VGYGDLRRKEGFGDPWTRCLLSLFLVPVGVGL